MRAAPRRVEAGTTAPPSMRRGGPDDSPHLTAVALQSSRWNDIVAAYVCSDGQREVIALARV